MAPTVDISIPRASTGTGQDGKPFTQFHVVLQLPLRKHEVRKRYSEFDALHANLSTQAGTPPPVPLPAKSWFRRTINNDALTEERRIGLEKYVRAIVGADDGRWRSSEAWRAFLNLPTPASESTAKAGSRASMSKYADPQDWLDAHRDLKSQMQTARHQLKQREAANTIKEQHSLSAEAKASLVRAAATVSRLEEGLKLMAEASRSGSVGQNLGEGELRRRRDLVSAAKSEIEGLEGVLRSVSQQSKAISNANSGSAAATDGDKAALWQGTAAAKPKGRVFGGPLKETERTRELDNEGVVLLQRQIMQEQDEDVLTLGKTVTRLKDMGLMINEELTIQNQMLGMLEEDTDRVQGKIDVARARINKIK